MEKKEAIKILKDFHDESALFSIRTALETLYPEFKESEDEKTRKEIVDYLKKNLRLEWATWLEKQSESYTKRDVDNAYIEGMAFAKTEIDKQSGQKTTWSKEDEKMMRFCCYNLNDNQKSWLKALKQRIGG